MSIRSASPQGHRADQAGIALILVLIFTVLLYVLVAELVVTARSQRLTGENDALVARMRNHMVYTLSQVEEQLADDLDASAGAEGAGAEGANPLAAMPGAPSGEGEGEEEPNDADSSQDSWFEPAAYADDDLTTYVWVEDENRKFNILTLVSPDRDFAEKSKERFIRLIDYLRDGTEKDLSASDGQELANAIIEWLEGQGRSEEIPRPLLKSDGDFNESEFSIPLHLDELRLLRSVDDELFFDIVLDERIMQGLESVLTIYTSLKMDPGDPNALPSAQSVPGTGEPAAPPPTPEPEPTEEGQAETPIGLGIAININTAPRSVLRCLFPEHEVSDSVIEAILRYRNEEEEEEELDEEALMAGAEYFGDMALGETPKRKIFKTLDDLEQIPEFANLSNPEIKEQFMQLTTVKSDVFSVHMASMYKRNEERRIYVLRRSRSVLVRMEGAEATAMHPLILLEDRHGLRVMPVDLPDDFLDFDYQNYLDEMDEFAREERKWNPFYLEFYKPPDQR